MKTFFQLLSTLSVVFFVLQRKNHSVRNIAAGLCIVSGIGLLFVTFRSPPAPPGPLEQEARIGRLIGQKIAETHKQGEVLLVIWPQINRPWENLANRMEQGLKQGLGRRFTIRRFPVEEWSNLDPPFSCLAAPPASTWEALAKRLPDCEILVSMVGHPSYPVDGLYTRCKSLFIIDSFSTLSPNAAQVDAAAPLACFVPTDRPLKLGETLLDGLDLVVPKKTQ